MQTSSSDRETLKRAADKERRKLAAALTVLAVATGDASVTLEQLEPLIRKVLDHGGYVVALTRILS